MKSLGLFVAISILFSPFCGLAQSDVWQHIDPISVEAKVISAGISSKILIPVGGALLVGGGAAAIIASSTGKPDPDPTPIDPPPVPFEVNDDGFNSICGQITSISPLLNDVGQNLVIDSIIGAPPGVLILPDGNIQLPANLFEDYFFFVIVSDSNGNTSNSLISISVTLPPFILIDDFDSLQAGGSGFGNVLSNDICQNCIVTGFDGGLSEFSITEDGNYSYIAPALFDGQDVYTIFISDSCGQSGTSQLTFFVSQPICSFVWPGNVETIPADCGQSNGSANPSVEHVGNYLFSWSNGFSGTNNINLEPGSYFLYIQDPETGCSDTVSYSITQLIAEYLINIEDIPGACGFPNDVLLHLNVGPSNPVNINIVGPLSAEILDWTEPTLLVSSQFPLLSGFYEVNITSSDQPACVETFSFEITLSAQPQLLIENIFNPGPPEFNNGLITLVLEGFQLPADVFMNGDFIITVFEPTFTIEGLMPGEYEFVANDFTGCLSEPLWVVLLPMGTAPPQEFSKSVLSPGFTSFSTNPNQLNNFVLKTPEGEESALVLPVLYSNPLYLQFNFESWFCILNYTQLNYQFEQNGNHFMGAIHYSEFAIGKSFELVSKTIYPSFGASFWNENQNDNFIAIALNTQLSYPIVSTKKIKVEASINANWLMLPTNTINISPGIILRAIE